MAEAFERSPDTPPTDGDPPAEPWLGGCNTCGSTETRPVHPDEPWMGSVCVACGETV